MKSPERLQRPTQQGIDPIISPSEVLADQINADIVSYRRLIQESHIRIEQEPRMLECPTAPFCLTTPRTSLSWTFSLSRAVRCDNDFAHFIKAQSITRELGHDAPVEHVIDFHWRIQSKRHEHRQGYHLCVERLKRLNISIWVVAAARRCLHVVAKCYFL